MTIRRNLQAIAAMIVLVAVFFFTTFYHVMGSEPTARQREILEELVRVHPHTVRPEGVWMLGRWDSDAGLEELTTLPVSADNAGACFKRLEELFPGEKDTLRDNPAATRGVDVLLAAAAMGSCRLVPDFYPEFVAANSPQPDFYVLRSYHQGLLLRAEALERQGDLTGAERCYQSALICGWHLTNARTSGVVYLTGLIFKLRGAEAYAKFLTRRGDGRRAEAAASYVERIGTLMRAFNWKAGVALGEFDGFACLPALIRIAREDSEVFWRKDAVIRLGTIRYGIPSEDGGSMLRNPLFEREADEALTAVAASDPDPSVRRLAIWVAKNITPPNYEQLKHTFME